MNRQGRIARIVSVTAGLLLLAAACGDDGDEAEDGETNGTPIRIATIATLEAEALAFPQTADGAQARVDAINEAGGINGRPLELTVCNDNDNPDEASVCVRDAVSDGAVAVIGGLTQQGDAITSGLEQAGIVYTGQRALSPGDFASPISFPLVGGGAASFSGLGQWAAEELGCESAYAITSDIPVSRSSEDVFQRGIEFGGGEFAGSTVTPAVNPDYAPAAASAAGSGADCITFIVPPPEMPKAVEPVRQAAGDATLLSTAGSAPPLIVEILSDVVEGMYLADSQLPVDFEGNDTIDQFHEEMQVTAPDADADAFALTSWLGVKVLADALESIDGEIDAAAVREAFENMDTVDTGGVTGEFGFTEESPVEDMPRLFNRSYLVFSVEGGAYVVDDPEFRDATEALG